MTVLPHPEFLGLGKDLKTHRIEIIKKHCGGMWLDRSHWLHADGRVIRKPLPEASTQAFIDPKSVILHTNGGRHKAPWWAIWNYMARPDVVIECHSQVDMDGTLAQAMPFNRRADCNYKANFWRKDGKAYGALSFETQDNGSATLATTPWTLAQFETLADAIAVQCIAYKIPCSVTTKWDGGGIGYHSQYSEWSTFKGKTCPGPARIRQMDALRQRVAEKVARYYFEAGGHCPGADT